MGECCKKIYALNSSLHYPLKDRKIIVVHALRGLMSHIHSLLVMTLEGKTVPLILRFQIFHTLKLGSTSIEVKFTALNAIYHE